MNHSDMYRLLQKNCSANECTLCKVIEGEHTGAALLLSGKNVLWADENAAFLLAHTDVLSAAPSAAPVELERETVFVERVGNKPRLIVCGGGHVASALISAMQPIGFELWLLEDREEFAEAARQKGIFRVLCGSYEDNLRTIPVSVDNYYVVMTRGHQYDESCLKTILSMESFAYVGLMASRARGRAMQNTLISLGIPEAAVDMLHTPIGLKIGAQTPQEIAISIAAELILEKSRLGRSKWMADELFGELTSGVSEKVLCTIIAKRGSAPRAAGTKMIVSADGPILGTVGGGVTEADIIRAAKEMLADPAAATRRISAVMNAEECIDKGLGCGGRIDVYLEKLS